VTETPIIAVGVDGTQSSRQALAWAAAEAVRRGAAVQVVTAWRREVVDGAPLASVDPAALLAVADRVQRDAIAEVIGPMAAKPPVTRQVVQLSPVEALVAASQHATLVVVGTHGRGPVRSLLLGSVSLAVITQAACPVVVIPPAAARV